MRLTVSRLSIIGLLLTGLCGLPTVQAAPVDSGELRRNEARHLGNLGLALPCAW